MCELYPGLDALDVAGLLALREAIDARLVALVDESGAGGLVGNDGPDVGSPPTKGSRAGGWVELRMVNGCGPYAYRRWWQDGRKRTEYLGKVKE